MQKAIIFETFFEDKYGCPEYRSIHLAESPKKDFLSTPDNKEYITDEMPCESGKEMPRSVIDTDVLTQHLASGWKVVQMCPVGFLDDSDSCKYYKTLIIIEKGNE